MQNISGFGIEDCSTEATLGWMCYRKYNKDFEFYTFNDEYLRDYIRGSIMEDQCAV